MTSIGYLKILMITARERRYGFLFVLRSNHSAICLRCGDIDYVNSRSRPCRPLPVVVEPRMGQTDGQTNCSIA